MKRIILLTSFLVVSTLSAQRGTTNNPDKSAALDLNDANRGFLLPRVSLRSTTDVATVLNPARSLMVYNTNAGMTGGGVGFYHWNGTVWIAGFGTAASSWNLDGNAGTATSFLGTTNDQPLRLRANNSEKMTIAANGKVGIGNTVPTAAFDVISPLNGEDLARFMEQNRTQGVAINYEGMSKFGSAPNSDFKITPKGWGVVSIEGPARVKKLDLGDATDSIVTANADGTLRKRAVADVVGATTNALSSSGNTITSTVNGKTATATVVNTNALGFSGTTLTSTVNGVASTTSLAGLSGWGLRGNNVAAADWLGSIGNVPVRFATNGRERMRIDTLGRVGIGYLTPKGALDIRGFTGVDANGLANFYHNNLTQGVSIGYRGISKVGTNANSDLDIAAKGTGKLNLNAPVLIKTLPAGAGTDEIVTADGSGNLRKRAAKDIIGAAAWGLEGNNGTAASFLGTKNNQPLRFRTNDTEKMTISAAGKVGIRNTNPTNFLDVKSDVNDDSAIGSFMRANGTKGLAVTSTGIESIGSDGNSTLRLKPKGTSPVLVQGSAQIQSLPAGAQGDAIVTADASGRLRKLTRTITATAPAAVTTATSAGATTVTVKNTEAHWNANKLQGRDVVATAPATGQVLRYNGTQWAPAAGPAATTVTADTPAAVQTSGNTATIKNTGAHWNANSLQGRNVAPTAPAVGDVLQWNGSRWVPGRSSSSGIILGTIGSGVTVDRNSRLQYSGTRITIPANSRYIIRGDFTATWGNGVYPSTSRFHLQFAMSSSSTSVVVPSIINHYYRSAEVMSGAFNGYFNQSWFANNTTNSPVTLYLFVSATIGGQDTTVIRNFAGGGDDLLYATPVN